MIKTNEIVQRLITIKQELKDIIIERDSEIDSLILALITGNHVLLLGTWGIAKSLLARELCKRITNGIYFEWLLTKTSDPSEILGPLSLKALEEDRFSRKTTGKIPQADIVFLDEIFKSTPAVLNNLLTILNEKAFHNDGKLSKIPLSSVIAASNEGPEDDSLMPLYDRLLFRFIVKPIMNPDNRLKMYSSFLDRRRHEDKSIINTITIEELLEVKSIVKNISFSTEILNSYNKLLLDLEIKHQIFVSDRRKNEALGVLQGSAFMDNRDHVIINDFQCLTPIFWTNESDIDVINNMISSLIDPFSSKLKIYKSDIDKMLKEIENSVSHEKIGKICKLKATINNLLKEVNIMSKTASESGIDNTSILSFNNLLIKISKELLYKELNSDIDETWQDL